MWPLEPYPTMIFVWVEESFLEMLAQIETVHLFGILQTEILSIQTEIPLLMFLILPVYSM